MLTHFKQSDKISIAFFISPHGFGHAARASAVMDALWHTHPSVCFEIFTRVPSWFFKNSLVAPFHYHDCLTDIGMAQKSSLHADLDETLRQLNKFLPFGPVWVNHLARQIKQLKCSVVVCDIAPLGIAAAREAGVPSVLIENFTWDWIYQHYKDVSPQFVEYANYLQTIFKSADHHIQTEPVCLPRKANLRTPPVSRAWRSSITRVRQRLHIDSDRPLILITMGGIPSHNDFRGHLQAQRHATFIIPGGASALKIETNVVRFPFDADLYHPDMVRACDAVVGKVGYSTLAEVYCAGIPFGYIPRPRFRESKHLVAFIEKEMSGASIDAEEFESGRWTARVDDLLDLPRGRRPIKNGSEQIADYIFALLYR